VGLIILTLLGLKYLPGWVKLVWLFQMLRISRCGTIVCSCADAARNGALS